MNMRDNTTVTRITGKNVRETLTALGKIHLFYNKEFLNKLKKELEESTSYISNIEKIVNNYQNEQL